MNRHLVILALLACAGCASVFQAPPDAGPPLVTRESLARQWFEIGNLYAELGDLDEAEAAYRRALELGMDQRARHNLGLVQVRMGMEALADARNEMPPDPVARRELRAYLQTLLDRVGAPEPPEVSENPSPALNLESQPTGRRAPP